MLGIKRRAAIAMGAAGMLVMAGVSTVAFAETPTPTAGATRTSYGEVFTANLAGALGIDQTKLTDAIKKAQTDTIDQAVTNGDLTKARADDMKQRLAENKAGQFGPFGGPGMPFEKGDRRGPGGPKMGGPMAGGLQGQGIQEAVAAKLGLTVQELQTQLRSGKSLLTIAKEKGVSEADLRAAIKAALKTQLDKSVADGKLTQAQADAALARIDSMPLDGSRPVDSARPQRAPRVPSQATPQPRAPAQATPQARTSI